VLSLADFFKMDFSKIRASDVLQNVSDWDTSSDDSGGEDSCGDGVYAYISADFGVSIGTGARISLGKLSSASSFFKSP